MITSAAPPSGGALGVTYGPFTATASGGSGSYHWSASGVPGVSIGTATGILSGTPTAAGVFSLAVTVADANNLTQTTSQSYPVTVVSAPLMITSGAPPANGAIGSAYSFPLTASGGSGVFLWSVSGVPGVTVNGTTGVLSGAPTLAGNLTLTVTLTNANAPSQSISHNYPVNVLGITSVAPPASGTVGMPYGPFTATAGGGSGSYLWSATGIAGVTINGATGVLSGVPTTPGLGMTLALTVTDTTTHLSTTQNYPVDIAGSALLITNTSLPGGIQNQPYSARLVGAGGSGSYALDDQRDSRARGERVQWCNQRKPVRGRKPHAERDAGRHGESFGHACYETVYGRDHVWHPQHHEFASTGSFRARRGCLSNFLRERRKSGLHMGRDGRARDTDTRSDGRHTDGNRSGKTGQLLIRAQSDRFGNTAGERQHHGHILRARVLESEAPCREVRRRLLTHCISSGQAERLPIPSRRRTRRPDLRYRVPDC